MAGSAGSLMLMVLEAITGGLLELMILQLLLKGQTCWLLFGVTNVEDTNPLPKLNSFNPFTGNSTVIMAEYQHRCLKKKINRLSSAFA
jgi:hypothetical protein